MLWQEQTSSLLYWEHYRQSQRAPDAATLRHEPAAPQSVSRGRESAESLAAVRERVAEAVPKGAMVRVSRDGATVHVDVSVPVRPPAAAGLPAVTVQAHVAAATEPGVPPHETRPANREPIEEEASPTRLPATGSMGSSD